MMPHLLTVRNLSAAPLVAPGRRTTSWAPIHWTLLHTNPFTQQTNRFLHKDFYTQRLLHTKAFTHRTLLHTHTRFNTQTLLHTYAFNTQKLLHTNTSTHRFTQNRREELRKNAWNRTLNHSFWRSNIISCERVRRTLCKSQIYLSFWRSNLISCETVAPDALQIAIYFSFWRSNLISCERVAPDALQIAILFQFLAIELHFVRNRCAGRFANRNFTSVFGDRTSFRAKELRRTLCKSQFYLSFWRSNLISCERVAPDALQIAILP